MTEIFLKFPLLFYLANEEIQHKTEWEISKNIDVIVNFPTLNFLVRKIKER